MMYMSVWMVNCGLLRPIHMHACMCPRPLILPLSRRTSSLTRPTDPLIHPFHPTTQATPAYLCTPTDVHVISKEAHAQAAQAHSALSLVNLVCKLSIFNLPGSGYLVKNALKPVVADDGEEFYFVDGIVGRQGPNYALAKRIQHWRAICARETDKVRAVLLLLVLVWCRWVEGMVWRALGCGGAMR